MPVTVDCAGDDAAIELAELVESLDRDFDPRDETALVEWAPALRRLARNRRFLADLVIEELKQHCFGQSRSNQYSAQVILLHGASKNYLIRANFWPADTDSVFTNSGAKAFFYGLPHDHNFSFLTAGYLGPGYWSDYYEYDYEDVLGYPGESVDLRFVERSQLSEGKVMLYRKHLDVHSQLPPESLSVSLNILAASPALEFQEQYSFDLESSTVTGFVNRSGLETLIRLAGTFGGGNGSDLIDHVARRHPSDRMRFAGWRAKAAQAPDVDRRIAVYEEAARSSDGQLSALARGEAARVWEGRPWLIGGMPPAKESLP